MAAVSERAALVTALGFFDGVHIGHAALLRRAAEAARQGPGNLSACVLTFDVHPGAVIPERVQPLLNTPAERYALLSGFPGIEQVLTVPFDRDMARMPWRAFIEYVRRRGAAHVVAGHDFRFGHGGGGDAARLSAACAALGMGCDIIPAVAVDGVTVSSTHIRGLVAAGDVERAAQFLGRPHFLSGTVARGRRVGAALGAPTLNLPLPDGVQPPAHGVYFTRVRVDGEQPGGEQPDGELPGGSPPGGLPPGGLPPDGERLVFNAVTNVGVRPTFENAGGGVWAESTLLDFSGELYGRRVRVEFLRHVRPERRFAGADALREQIGRDIAAARGFFGPHRA